MNRSDGAPREINGAGILVAAFALAMLLPITVTTFLGDDTFNSYINGAMRYAHKPFWIFIDELNASWIRRGRFFPGALVESYGLFHIVPSLAAYKAFQLIITLLNVGTFFVVLRELRISRGLSLLGTLMAVSIFQMRDYHDGLLGFSGNIEFILELGFLSLLGLLEYSRGKGGWLLIGSLCLYGVGLLTYEVTYLFWLAFLAAVMVERPWRRALKLIAPYIMLSALVVGIQLYVKATSHAAADADYSVSLNVAALAGTFFKQLSAAIPLTYIAFDPSNLFARGSALVTRVPPWTTIAIFVLASTAAWISAKGVREPIGPKPLQAIVAIGFILWLTPALLVASSARYQRELVLGLGHVPVYIEYYGVALILVALISEVVRRWGPPGPAQQTAIAAVIGIVAIATYASNAIVISRGIGDKEGRSNIEAALESGLLRGVPSGSALYVDGSIAPNRYLDESATDAKYFYFNLTNSAFDVHSIGALTVQKHCATGCTTSEPGYELINVPNGEDAGFAALGRLESVATARGQVRSFASDVTVYLRGVPRDEALAIRYTEHGCGADRALTRVLEPVAAVSETVRLKSACGSIEMDGMTVAEAPTAQ